MTTKETFLVCELIEACCAALAFIDQAGPDDFILSKDERVKETLTAGVARVHRFLEGGLPTIHLV